MVLRPKARLIITVARPGAGTRVFEYRMIKHRDPKKTTRCGLPGRKRLKPC
jgi:hypothetical protein